MRFMAWALWALSAIWIVLSVFGAMNFQELYGGTSGLQVFLGALLLAIVASLVGWWAYRRASAREDRP